MATQPLIDRDTASKIITILDFVYSLGVEDCHYKQDEGLAREFLEKTSEQGRYGLLGKEIYFDWFEWELQLKRAARETKYPFRLLCNTSDVWAHGSLTGYRYLSPSALISIARV